MCDSSTRSRSSSIHSDTSVQTLHSFFTGTTETSFNEESIEVHTEMTPCVSRNVQRENTPDNTTPCSTPEPLRWNRGRNRRQNRKGRRPNPRNCPQSARQQTQYSAPLQYRGNNRGYYHMTAAEDWKQPLERSGDERRRFEVAQFLWQGKGI